LDPPTPMAMPRAAIKKETGSTTLMAAMAMGPIQFPTKMESTKVFRDITKIPMEAGTACLIKSFPMGCVPRSSVLVIAILILFLKNWWLLDVVGGQGLVFSPVPDPTGHQQGPVIPIVQTGDVDIILPPGLEELLPAHHGDLLQGLQAVAHKGGGDHGQFAYPGIGQALELMVGEGPQPGIVQKAGLEGGTYLPGIQPHFFFDPLGGVQTLVPVTAMVGHRIGATALPVDLAMEVGRIRFPDLPFGDPVIGEQQVVVGKIPQTFLNALGKQADIVPIA